MVNWEQEVKPNFGYLDASHIFEFLATLVETHFILINVNFVLVEVLDEETLPVYVPEDQRMFLAECVDAI